MRGSDASADSGADDHLAPDCISDDHSLRHLAKWCWRHCNK